MSNLFWLSDAQWGALEPHLPTGRRGVKPRRNREVISGIMHVLHIGCRWVDCPAEYGPPTTIYNRFNRWSKAGIWQNILARLVAFDQAKVQCIDSTSAKAHRCAAGGEGGAQKQAIGRSRGGRTTKVHAVVDGLGRLIAFILTEGNRHDLPPAAGLIEPLPKAESLLADAAYDSDAFRAFLNERGTTPDIKQNPTRKKRHPFNRQAYRGRNVIERAFCQLKDWRRLATRYDKLARNFAATVILAAIFRWWI